MQAVMLAEATSIPHLRKMVPFASIHRIWDSCRQKAVNDQELKDTVRYEAAHQYPPVPGPLSSNWVQEYTGRFT